MRNNTMTATTSNGLHATVTEVNGERRAWVLDLPSPPTTNTYYRNITVRGRARTVLSRDGRRYKETVAGLCTVARCKPLDGPVKVTLYWRRQRKAGDLDGIFKAPLDAIQGFCYTNDKQIVELHAYRSDDGEPGVTLTVEAM